MARSRKKLGDILVEWGVTTPDQIEKAVAMARGSGRRLGDMLVEMGASSDDNVAKALAKQFGLEFVDLSAQGAADRINPKLIPEDLIRKHHVLPLKKTNGRLQLIMEDPMNLELADMLRFRLNTEIETKLASPTRIRSLIDAIFGGGSTIIGAGMVGADESLVTESIDRTIDRSVDRSVDKSIDITVEDAGEPRPALVGDERIARRIQGQRVVAGIDGRAADQEGMRLGRSAVVLKEAEQRIDRTAGCADQIAVDDDPDPSHRRFQGGWDVSPVRPAESGGTRPPQTARTQVRLSHQHIPPKKGRPIPLRIDRPL